MERLSEHEVFAAVINETAASSRLDKISSHNGKGNGSYCDCEEYVITIADGYFDHRNLSKFRITDGLRKRWRENNIAFCVYLYLKETKIVGGHIFKFRELKSSNGLVSSGYEMEATQQELRIVKRILSYITEVE